MVWGKDKKVVSDARGNGKRKKWVYFLVFGVDEVSF